jgi:hypothetical protein
MDDPLDWQVTLHKTRETGSGTYPLDQSSVAMQTPFIIPQIPTKAVVLTGLLFLQPRSLCNNIQIGYVSTFMLFCTYL